MWESKFCSEWVVTAALDGSFSHKPLRDPAELCSDLCATQQFWKVFVKSNEKL